MSLLCKKAIGKEIKNNILTLSEEARIAKEKDPTIINATIGMLYDDDEKLMRFPTLEKIQETLTIVEKYAYADTTGGKDFALAIKKWVFRNYLSEFEKNMHLSVISTPGGSGAISNTFSNYLNEGEKVLLPSYMWSAYKNMARELGIICDTYELFENKRFNLSSVKEKILEHKKNQGRVLLVINDPCHNPTGLCLKHEEWQELVSFINEVTTDGTPFILLYDMAYIDFYNAGFDYSRQNIRLFQRFNDSVLTVLAFSGSKTFSLYGLRVGAMIGLSKKESDIIEFNNANEYSSRAKWSNVSKLGLSIITKCILNDTYKNAFEQELSYAKELLEKRSTALIKALNSFGIEPLPFDCGFFVCIKVDHPTLVKDSLVELGCYVIPLDNAIRIAICSIVEKDMLPLAQKISQVLKGRQ